MSQNLKSRRTLTFAAAVLSGAVACSSLLAPDASADTDSPSYANFDASGNLLRPTEWREWVYVGTPVTPNELNNGKAAFPEFHNVYIDPASWSHYQETGEFRDGTILVKELASVGSKSAVSGNGYFPGEFLGLEATVKSKKQFPDQPGNWAYFSFTNSGAMDSGALKSKAPAFATAQCNACHQGAAKQDWVFTQYYPVLRAARGH